MPSSIRSLRQLQTLPLFVSGKLPKGSEPYVCRTRNSGILNTLRGLNLHGELNITRLENIRYATPADEGQLFMKKNLESLGLYWGFIPRFKDSFAKPPNAPAEVGTKFPDWALPNLVAADFTNCRSCEHLPALGNLLLLKTLSLQGMHGVKSVGTEFYGDGTDIWFPSLEELSVSDFANLKEWSSANDGNAFRRLKKLTVKSCPKLAHTPLPQSLQYLELRDCNPTMVPIADLSLLFVLILDKIPDLVSLPEGLFASASLSSLKIVSSPKLHSMPLEIQNLSSLKSLTIRCELTSLSSSLEQLTLLEDLTILDCPKLGSFPAGVQHLSSLRSLMVLNCPWFDSLPEGLQNVKTLYCLEISSCDNLTALLEWFLDLASLRSLTIYHCPNLTLLPLGFKLLTKLQHLSIQECPELEERCRQGSGEDWSKIAHVPHKYIGSPQVRLFGEASTSGSSSVQGSSHKETSISLSSTSYYHYGQQGLDVLGREIVAIRECLLMIGILGFNYFILPTASQDAVSMLNGRTDWWSNIGNVHYYKNRNRRRETTVV
ncbi:hypothetical protein L3X38_043055 [Prunus dulcis]|uniref:R13L1/DRL21-like LRR repeat region domain-containing protein n=1 Tax=Prunus dulcis TaxID=3755 RepID=A0AAD4UXE9_PRUDU|nr:hypothetical protein L3X38_043055 [Prunus dulcis]